MLNFLSFSPLVAESLAIDRNDIISPIPAEVCALRDNSLKTFVVDCPTEGGLGVGNYTAPRAYTGEFWDLLKGNCFTFCRRG